MRVYESAAATGLPGAPGRAFFHGLEAILRGEWLNRILRGQLPLLQLRDGRWHQREDAQEHRPFEIRVFPDVDGSGCRGATQLGGS
jgi:hypothetical protein